MEFNNKKKWAIKPWEDVDIKCILLSERNPSEKAAFCMVQLYDT